MYYHAGPVRAEGPLIAPPLFSDLHMQILRGPPAAADLPAPEPAEETSFSQTPEYKTAPHKYHERKK